MGFIAPFLPQIIGAAGGIAGSLLGGKDKQTTTSNPNITPEQQALQRLLIGQATQQLGGPLETPDFQASRNQAVTNVNRATDNSRQRLETNLAGRGFGRSGLIAAGANELETNRVNAIGNIEASIVQFLEQNRQQQQQQRFQNALSLIPNSTGQTTTTQAKRGFDPFQFLSPFLNGNLFGGGGGNPLGGSTNLGDVVNPGLPDISGSPAPVFSSPSNPQLGVTQSAPSAGIDSALGSPRLNKQAELIKRTRR